MCKKQQDLQLSINLTRVSFSTPSPPPQKKIKNKNKNCRKLGFPTQKSLENGLKQLSRLYRSVETTRSSIINKLDHGFRIPHPPPKKKSGKTKNPLIIKRLDSARNEF